MFLPILMVITSSSVTPPRPQIPMSEDSRGRQILEAAYSYRMSILTGDIVMRRRSILVDGTDEKLCRALFDVDAYRIDTLEDTFYQIMAESLPKAASVLASGQPPEILVYDGDHVLCRRFNGSAFESSYRTLDDMSVLKFFNARLLGLPLSRHPQEISKPFYREGNVISVVDHPEGTVTITIASRFDNAPRNPFTVQLTIDPQRDYSVTAFRLEGMETNSEHFVLIGTCRLDNYDGIWFPRHVRYEQWLNGNPAWGFEDEVLSASLNKPIPQETFSWTSMNIQEGETIFSESGNVSPKCWSNGQAIPWKASD